MDSDNSNRGDRGELGKGTPGKRLKALWRRLKFAGSLKAFLRTLKDNVDLKAWKLSKAGKSNQKRTDANAKRVRETGQATKLAKKAKTK
jgi:hypothetical protein